MQTFVTNNVFLDEKVKTQQQNKKTKHRNPYRSRELNPGPFAPKANAFSVHHRDKWE